MDDDDWEPDDYEHDYYYDPSEPPEDPTDWAEEQRARRYWERLEQLAEEGQRVWTPTSIFDQCCVKWLIDGPARNGPLYDSGCDWCGKDHPSIELSFDVLSTTVTATLSHALDPFVRYFEGLVGEGKAIKLDELKSYQINGYLRPVESALCSHDGFKNHLVKIAEGSMEASDNAQSAELEEKERATKRPRLCTKTATIPVDLMEKAIGILLNHRYLRNDHVTLYCMRPVCKAFKNIAMSAASERTKTLDLSVTLLTNGMMSYDDGWTMMDEYDSETCRADNRGWNLAPVFYDKKEKVSFAFQEGEQEEDGLFPVTSEVTTFSWDSGELHDIDEDDDYKNENAEWARYAYEGNLLRVYWHPDEEDPVDVPKRKSSYGRGKPSLGILVAEFYLDGNPDLGIVTQSKRGVNIKYEVLESNTTKSKEKIEEEDPEADDEESSSSHLGEPNNLRRLIKFTGKVQLLKVKFDFGILVRAHAHRMRDELPQEHIDILKHRPLTMTEKNYYEFITNNATLKERFYIKPC